MPPARGGSGGTRGEASSKYREPMREEPEPPVLASAPPCSSAMSSCALIYLNGTRQDAYDLRYFTLRTYLHVVRLYLL